MMDCLVKTLSASHPVPPQQEPQTKPISVYQTVKLELSYLMESANLPALQDMQTQPSDNARQPAATVVSRILQQKNVFRHVQQVTTETRLDSA